MAEIFLCWDAHLSEKVSVSGPDRPPISQIELLDPPNKNKLLSSFRFLAGHPRISGGLALIVAEEHSRQVKFVYLRHVLLLEQQHWQRPSRCAIGLLCCSVRVTEPDDHAPVAAAVAKLQFVA